MYRLGYANNNCIGCVKGGAAYWNKIRKDFPSEFQKMADLEKSIGASCMKNPLSELHPKAGGKSKPILPDCGTFCEIEFADLIDPITLDIIEGRKSIGQLNLF